jgi:hypothetical protein
LREDRPVFFHGFVKKTAAEHRKRVENPMNDALPMARKA